MSRAVPYKCPSCGGAAVIASRNGMATMVSYLAAVAIPLFALDRLGAPQVALFAACVAVVVAAPVVLARIARFERAEEE